MRREFWNMKSRSACRPKQDHRTLISFWEPWEKSCLAAFLFLLKTSIVNVVLDNTLRI